MSQLQSDLCVLLADVTGSTALYESIGDLDALYQITEYIGRIKRVISAEGGHFIHSKGDDILCTFETAGEAIEATRKTLAIRNQNALSVHAGLHYGPVVRTDDDIYGDTVNLTARLASAANNREVLISDTFVSHAGPDLEKEFRFINTVDFKGKTAPIGVYSLTAERTTSVSTQIGGMTEIRNMPVAGGTNGLRVELRYDDKTYICEQDCQIKIGRADDCDINIDVPWVSRQHAIIQVHDDKVSLIDRSSGGTFVKIGDGHEISVVRQSVLLAGEGKISLALPAENPNSEPITYEIKTD